MYTSLYILPKNMISSSYVASILYNDLDQNAYTSWYDDNKILQVINSACNYICAYGKRPWTLKSEEILLTVKSNTFTATSEIFFPYWAFLDEEEKTITNVPIFPSFRNVDGANKAYVSDGVVTTSEQWLKLNILYHKWFNKLKILGADDIFFPAALEQAVIHVCLWFLYPSGLDIGSTLANQHFNMADKLLSTYAKAYGFLIQPKNVEAANIYTKF